MITYLIFIIYKTPGSEKVKGELRIVEIDFLKWK